MKHRSRYTAVVAALAALPFLHVTPAHADEVFPIRMAYMTPFAVTEDATFDLQEAMELQAEAAAELQRLAANPPTTPTDAITGESLQDDVDTSTSLSGETERGYKLRHRDTTPRTEYIYQSAAVRAVHLTCTSEGGCSYDSSIKLSFKEYVVGGSSKNWTLTFYAQKEFSKYAYTTWFEYQCAVNIKNATDKYCNAWKSDGADGQYGDLFNNGDTLTRYFGSYTNATKFPMVKLHTTWSTGQEAVGDDHQPGEKFRGWDVCVTKSSTRLCSVSGDGY